MDGSRPRSETRARWSLFVHIGLKEAMSWAVRSFLLNNRVELWSRGTAVVQIDPGSIDASVSRAESASAHAVASAPGLLDLPQARIEHLARTVHERQGRLVAVIVLTSPRLLAVRKHVGRLRLGTTAPLSRARFKAVNFVPAVQRWDETIGAENVHLRATRFEGSTSQMVSSVASELGIDVAGLELPTGRIDTRLTAPAAEALRLVNIGVHDVDGEQARELRRLAARTLVGLAAADDAPVDLPPDVAARLESSMEPHMQRLTGRLPPGEAEWLRAAPVPPQGSSFVLDRTESLWVALRSQPRLAAVLPTDRNALISPEERLRQDRDDLVAAWRSGDGARVRAGATRLREHIESLPDFRLVGPLLDGPVIPRRLVQYWEPLPPPDYMQNWLSSWSSLGMAGASRLVGVDEARAVVAHVAGPLGERAMDLTNHPAQRADLFRYADLYVHGGWYVDADHEARVPHDEVLTWPVRHVFVRRKRRLPNGFIGAEPGSTVMHEALMQACTNVVQSHGRMHTMESTGPILLTRTAKPYLEGARASGVVLPGGTVFGGLLQTIHGDAEYKVTGHWRDAQESAVTPRHDGRRTEAGSC